MKRREFLKLGLAGSALLLIRVDGSGKQEVLAAAIPGGSLNPLDIAKYQLGLVVPPAMPKSKAPAALRGASDYYEIAVREFQQRILPPGLPTTKVWSYCSLANPRRTFADDGTLDAANVDARGVPGTLNYPSFTIEAHSGRPVRIKWINQLRANPDDPTSDYLPHLLTVDPTLHWANPAAGSAPDRYGYGSIDSTPEFFDAGGTHTPAPYVGPVPFVTHVHGALDIGEESDGYAEAWYLPQAGNIPAGYATEGSWYKTYRQKYWDTFRQSWEPGSATFYYGNRQRATTLWYHDHVLGMTRLNVYAGPAGFYVVRGGADDRVINTRTRRQASLPSDAYEIPIVVQDRSFDSGGQLFFPNAREFFDGYTGPFIPTSDMHPYHNPEFFGNTMVVNGRTWPKLQVEQRRYRFRFLNGCNSRFLALKFVAGADFDALPAGDAAASIQAPAAALPVWQVGNEGGFLRAPVDITTANGGVLLMGLAERADVIVDFGALPVGTQVYLTNEGPDEPFGGGAPGLDFPIADRDTTRQVMLFEVVAATARDNTTPPELLGLPAIAPLPGPSLTRKLALIEEDSLVTPGAGPRAAFCGTVEPIGGVLTGVMKKWVDPVTENPALGAVEDWEIYNFTMDAHPIHLHEVPFEVIGRRPFTMSGAMDVMGEGAEAPPTAWENGLKDTVIAYPGEVTRIRARFDRAGRYVWHCHIVDHEDNEMMRPYDIGPKKDRSQRHTGRIRVDHRHNEAVLTYVHVGDATEIVERIKPASGLDAIVGTKLIIDALNPPAAGVGRGVVTEVGGGEGYGVNTLPATVDRKTIEGSEQLAFMLTAEANGRGSEKTAMLDFATGFRLAVPGGSAHVVVEAFLDGVSIAGPQTLTVKAAKGSFFTPSYLIAFGAPGQRLPFNKLVFSAGQGKYSLVRAIEIRTITATLNGDGTVGVTSMADTGAQARQVFVCDL